MIKITYFVHGTTTHNEMGIAAGWLPGELSNLGIKQSIELGNVVSNKKFEVIFSSDLKRAVDTANLAFGSNFQIIQDKRLREADLGDFTNKLISEFRSNLIEYIKKPFPNGESYKDVETRISKFLGSIRKKYSGKHVAIVAHHAPQLALDVILKSRTWRQAIAEDWRLTKSWKPGWEYYIRE